MADQTSPILRKVSYLQGTKLYTIDGEVGTVVDLLFDDQSWRARYLVIDTGGWISGRQFLFSPEAFSDEEWDGQTIHVKLKKSVFEDSPEIDLQKPVSRQALDDLHEYFSWPIWHTWQMGTPMQPAYVPAIALAAGSGTQENDAGQDGDPHLRSAGEVRGYSVRGLDEEIGILDAFFVGLADWDMEYFNLDTRSWLNRKKALVSTEHIQHIDFAHHEVAVDFDRGQVENCPEFEPGEMGRKPYSLAQYRYHGFDPYMIRIAA